ncbi:MAG: hypothetical protein M5U12_05200 [Verrucomicrobia bacterium]|nr:hypothetical protein [Verrucomicrobiota bacterium]
MTRGSVEELAAAMKIWATRPALDFPARRELHNRVAAVFSLERAAENLTALYRALLVAPPPVRAQPA